MKTKVVVWMTLHEGDNNTAPKGQKAQGKSKMAGYGKQVLVRNTFLWFMSVIYLFAFSSLYVQIPGKCYINFVDLFWFMIL